MRLLIYIHTPSQPWRAFLWSRTVQDAMHPSKVATVVVVVVVVVIEVVIQKLELK